MPLTPEDIAFEQSLLPPDPSWGATGAVRPPFDARDYPAIWHPGIRAGLRVGTPASADFLQFIKEPRYDQGQEGSCTCFATSGNCTMAHSEADGSWPQYAGHQLYAEAGGSGNSGADPRRVIQLCVDNGIPLVSGGREKIIKSYVALDRTPGTFRAQVKAAIAVGEAVLIYCLLPIPFGWNSGTVLSSAYHEWLSVGYQVDGSGREWCLVLNSWGDSWPGDAPPGTPRGVGRVLFDALEQKGGQNGYLGGFVATTLTITPPPPPPPPPPDQTRTISGKISGTGLATLAVGQTLSVTSATFMGQLQVTQISDGDNNPPPPPPPSDLTVHLYQRRTGSNLALWAHATDSRGVPVTGIAVLASAGVSYGSRSASQIPAVWVAPIPPGQPFTVLFTAADGRQAQATGTA